MSVKLLTGDVRAMLATLPSDSVHVICTSPPYFGLRSYQTEPQVWPADGCDGCHVWDKAPATVENRHQVQGATSLRSGRSNVEAQRNDYLASGQWCTQGCWRGELGSEPTPSLFIEHLVQVFREVRRVLHPSGVMFINIGDSYAGSGKGPTGHNGIGNQEQRQGFTEDRWKHSTLSGSLTKVVGGQQCATSLMAHDGFKPKDLMMMPARLVIALQDDGWWVRSQIVWDKRSCMPESVPDRPTNAHEMIYLLSKSRTYYYDAEAVREPHEEPWRSTGRPDRGFVTADPRDGRVPEDGQVARFGKREYNPAGRNMRNVWRLGPAPVDYDFCLACGFFGRGPTRPKRRNGTLTCPSCGDTESWAAHYAAFVPEIPRRCILAGTSERGVCPACLAPWRRVVERERLWTPKDVGQTHRNHHLTPQAMARSGNSRTGNYETATRDWQPTCTCDAGPPIASTVLDCFAGTGTTLLVADRLGRDAIGIELSPRYSALCRARLTGDGPLWAEPELPMPEDEPIADSSGVEHATLPLFEVTP